MATPYFFGLSLIHREIARSISLIHQQLDILKKDIELVHALEVIVQELKTMEGIIRYLECDHCLILPETFNHLIAHFFDQSKEQRKITLEKFSHLLDKTAYWISAITLKEKMSFSSEWHWVLCVNQLRDQCNTHYLSAEELIRLGVIQAFETCLLTPELMSKNIPENQYQDGVKKITILYQKLLVALIKDQNVEFVLLKLIQLLNQLKKITSNHLLYSFYGLAIGLLESVHQKVIVLDSEKKQWLAQLGRYIEKTDTSSLVKVRQLQNQWLAFFLNLLSCCENKNLEKNLTICLSDSVDLSCLNQLLFVSPGDTAWLGEKNKWSESLMGLVQIREQLESSTDRQISVELDFNALMSKFAITIRALKSSGGLILANQMMRQYQIMTQLFQKNKKITAEFLVSVAGWIISAEIYLTGLIEIPQVVGCVNLKQTKIYDAASFSILSLAKVTMVRHVLQAVYQLSGELKRIGSSSQNLSLDPQAKVDISEIDISIESLINAFNIFHSICVCIDLPDAVRVLELTLKSFKPHANKTVKDLSGEAQSYLSELCDALLFYFEWGSFGLDWMVWGKLLEDSVKKILFLDTSLLRTAAEAHHSKLNNQVKPQSVAEVFIESAQYQLTVISESMKSWVREERSDQLVNLQEAYRILRNLALQSNAFYMADLAESVDHLLSKVMQSHGRAGAALVILLEKIKDKMSALLKEFSQGIDSTDSINPLIEESKSILVKIDKNPTQDSSLDAWVFDQTLLNIFCQETLCLLGELDQKIHISRPELIDQNALIRIFNNVKCCSDLVGAQHLAEMSGLSEIFVRLFSKTKKVFGSDMVVCFENYISQIQSSVQEQKLNKVFIVTDKEYFIKLLTRLADIYLEKDLVFGIDSKILDKKQHEKIIELFSSDGLDTLISAFYSLEQWHFKGASAGELDRVITELTLLNNQSKSLSLSFLSALTEVLIEYYEQLRIGPSVDVALYQYTKDAYASLIESLDQLASDQVIVGSDNTLTQLQVALSYQVQSVSVDDEIYIEKPDWSDLEKASIPYDHELVHIFLEEAEDLVKTAMSSLQRWVSEPQELLISEELHQNLHTLKGGARLIGIKPIELVAHQLASIYEGVGDNRVQISEELFSLLIEAHQLLEQQIQQLAQQFVCHADQELYLKLQHVIDHMSPRSIRQNFIANWLIQEKIPMMNDEMQSVQIVSESIVNDRINKNLKNPLDLEVMNIFFEESDDLLSQLEEGIQEWMAKPKQIRSLEEIKRALHTLKGGARLTGLESLGDLSHEFENFLIESEQKNKFGAEDFFTALSARYSKLAQMVEQIKQSAHQASQAMPMGEKVSFEAQSSSLEVSQWALHSHKDTIKVPSELLDKWVNLSSESALIRNRIEQEVNQSYHVVHEMNYSLLRVKDLLKDLDMEVESSGSQRLKQQNKVAKTLDFLQIDQHSNLHHISKSLLESTSDLNELKEQLIERYRDAAALLLQQQRMQTEIQDQLLQSRMVSFTRLLPRLKLLVKQVSAELNKSVMFEFVGVEDRLDRTSLERMLVPLEHMLRNAIDHGIESSAERIALGKSEQGRITLLLAREGADIVLRLSDDGRGIDVNQVKLKAIEQGLMEEDAQLTDHDILQFIFKSGFSTKSEVTQLSGRGIGMDVVFSEIKQMGGTMKIHSAMHVGTQFSIRLPFTLSLNRALVVKVGEDFYAIPMSYIEGVTRLSVEEWQSYDQDPQRLFEYANKKYQMKYLGLYVHGQKKQALDAASQSLPVLFIRGGEYPVALQVDAMMGSREVVVQAVGPQLSHVIGISGATILGDGSVVIILDMVALLRAERAGNSAHEAQRKTPSLSYEKNKQHASQKMPQNILIVDDSITVRRVLSRLLQRHGIQTVTAKDGVEAMALIQHQRPDLLLVDVEMPRMDGFELVAWLRSSSQWKDIPVMMITSRVGEQYRQRAESLGVLDYMSKPFQEDHLMERIQALFSSVKIAF